MLTFAISLDTDQALFVGPYLDPIYWKSDLFHDFLDQLHIKLIKVCISFCL